MTSGLHPDHPEYEVILSIIIAKPITSFGGHSHVSKFSFQLLWVGNEIV
jgi:hypothetical protein